MMVIQSSSDPYPARYDSAVSSVIELSREYLGQGCVDLAVKIRVRMEK